MKSMILTVAAVFLSLVSFSQEMPDYYREFGIHGGIAPFSKPNNVLYTGSKNKLPYVAQANLYYNFTEHIQTGLDVGMTHWEATGNYQVNGLNGQPGGSRDITYLYADRAWNVCARFNYLIPTYDEYHINRANFYFGVAAGAIFTVNDKGNNYSQYMGLPGEENRYVSQYNYDYGVGYTLGVQVGYSYYLGNHFGLNIEAAPRFNYVNIVDKRNGSASGQLQTFSYPVSAGLKFRF